LRNCGEISSPSFWEFQPNLLSISSIISEHSPNNSTLNSLFTGSLFIRIDGTLCINAGNSEIGATCKLVPTTIKRSALSASSGC